ncbi:NADH:ubiquinone oxidoreductase subunit 4 (subunit M) [Halanaerobium saccharolyticum]|uniref:NADH:ubiquinone oxidoreductase subunit 4 (Subunit M) n=1 Tax=Halanaerobium saccharolyticum TaxID=43595 RepID=A0A4R7Z628_9FIRM|nr:proton-conducting transporter membrane subunit [Halanaerobium saccharolyticum]RAK10553.1 NADH:ubiquinone oxidoreductase subunit 4 (subunit M) [Halanaerobium saccharolyticum]TDW06690.1 NADH:ubiquinone oxidoreductase subunit 4 (subunit M) [Halanaerobium saccharolyticum]TDX62325.1 NADH:ubiquinone oxidoreductase subunit 4 (subunit M) [Halanaerobium saccharolyticum]
MEEFISTNFIFTNINILFLSTGILITFFTLLSSWRKIVEFRFFYLINLIFFITSFFLVISTKNWFIFMIGWELATLTTSLMLAWDDKNIAWEYFVIQFIGGSFLILTTLTAYTNGYQFIGAVEEFWLQLMFIIALGVKSAVIGLHSWVPYIYREASPGFCALSSGLVAKLGYITLLRVISDGNRLLLYLGLIMIFYGGIKALEEKNYKLILAYSSISQFGFITLAIGSGNIYGYYGAVLHIIAHAFAKSTLFNGAGNWIKEFNSTSIFDFKRCEIRQKVNTISTIFSFLSLMAFPFFIGYNSKNLIKYSLSSIPMFEFLLHLGSILTVAYALKILWIIFFKDLKDSNFNFKVKLKSNYQPTFLENISILLPALSLIILAVTANIYLGHQFNFNYLSGLITTAVYLIVAYLIRFPIMSRIEH